ncbi:MAG: hypothetical protein ACK4N5_05845 [Myxococcales bacterium]
MAVVDKQPLMQSELEFEARVALIAKGGTEAVYAALPDEVLASVVDYVIGQKVAHAEAERLGVFAVDDAEVVKGMQAFAQKFPHDRAYHEFLLAQEASEDQLAAIIRRDLRVARYVDSKVKLMARVTEAELRRFYDTHQEDFAGQSYNRVREGIRALLIRERYQDLARTQLEQLRARSDIRLVAAWARRAARPPPPPVEPLRQTGDIESDDDTEEGSP